MVYTFFADLTKLIFTIIPHVIHVSVKWLLLEIYSKNVDKNRIRFDKSQVRSDLNMLFLKTNKDQKYFLNMVLPI